MQQLPDNVLLGAFDRIGPQHAPAAPDAAGPAPGDDGRLYYRAKTRPRYTRTADAEHPWETAAIELERFLAETPALLAEAVTGRGGRAPFAADAPRDEQVQFWLTQFLLPDGTINQPAVAAFLQNADPPQVHALAAAIRAQRERGEAAP